MTLRTSFLSLVALVFVSSAGAEDFKVSDLNFSKPETWKSVEVQSAMRKAQLSVGEEGEVVFFHFGPGAAGGKKANIDRWFGQFKEGPDAINAKTEELKAGDIPVTLVSANGTFLAGRPGGPKTGMPDYALLGAIIEAKGGSIFVKFTGKKATVDAAAKDFKAMVTGAKE
ncbi:MAG: hypothetical protein AAGI48_17295 [Verrucomicrobiota bacterium]